MRFTIKFTLEAEQEFLDLPNNIKPTIQRAINERLEESPLSYGKPLRYSFKGHRSLRVSNYRIIYKVQEQIVTVVIVKVGIRRDIYE